MREGGSEGGRESASEGVNIMKIEERERERLN